MSPLTLGIAQIVISIALVACVLLQQRGGGIGVVGGLQTQFYGTRRGLEKIIFWLTIILGVLFIALAVVSFII
ncbi:MAG: preprotein translocase subunit SecG [Candidatus Paceibacterota bacterium]|jgi:preprotein translocase subunit SecG